MKREILFILVCICSISCQDMKVVEGSGKKVQEVRKIGNYTAIKVSCGIIVEAIQGDNISLSIETDDNVLPLVFTEINANTLEIGVFDEYVLKPGLDVKICIQVPEIQKIELSKGALLRGLGMWNLKKLDLDLSTSAFFSNDTVWCVDDLKISASTVASYHVYIQSKQITVEAEKGSNGYLSGSTDYFEVEGSLGSRLNAKELEYRTIGNVDLSSGANLGLKERITYDESKGGLVY